MGAHSTDKFRATAAPSIGTGWEDVANIYDGNVNTYAKRTNATSTSATHINGFGITVPSNATVTSVEIHSKLYSANDDGYIWVYVYTDEGPTSVKAKEVVNGAELTAQYVTHTYTAEELQTALESKGVCGGDIRQLLNTLRVRFVMGDAGDKLLTLGICRVYDNYVVVNYTIPDYVLTLKATGGGTVTGGGTYEEGTSVTIKATPHEGYRFVSWSDGNTNASRSITVKANKTLTATFEKLETSKIYCGTQKVSVYCGTQKVSVYCGTQKLI